MLHAGTSRARPDKTRRRSDWSHPVPRCDAGGARFRGSAELGPVLETYYLQRLPRATARDRERGGVGGGDRYRVEDHDAAGVFATPAGEIPPTGRIAVLEACDVVRIDSDGMIKSWHSYFDQANLMAQLVR